LKPKSTVEIQKDDLITISSLPFHMKPVSIPPSFPIQWNKPFQFISESGESEDLDYIFSTKNTKANIFDRNSTEEQENNSLF
jgi:hypothetical protein